MNWLQPDRFLGAFFSLFGLTTLLALWFLVHEKTAAQRVEARLEATVNELARLRRNRPFPNEENLRTTRAQIDSYRASLLVLETELKSRMFPRVPLQPNEFQAQLRLAVNDVAEHAASAKVQLPANFHLGFDQYATSLPNSEAAPRLGRQLRAIEWVVNTIIDAHADSLGGLSRAPLPEEKSAVSTIPRPGTGVVRPTKRAAAKEKIVDSATIDLTFSGSPAAIRRVINQIAATKDQFYVLRTLVVKNQVDKGPRRGGPEGAPAPAPPPDFPGSAGARVKQAGINFIVGTEHLEVAARIEILRFSFPEKEIR